MPYQIDETKLRSLLARSYEAGWSGVKELQDQFVESLIIELNQQGFLVKDQSPVVKWEKADISFTWDSGPINVTGNHPVLRTDGIESPGPIIISGNSLTN